MHKRQTTHRERAAVTGRARCEVSLPSRPQSCETMGPPVMWARSTPRPSPHTRSAPCVNFLCLSRSPRV
ncbi:hypothetical protein STXM2123_671 [Streptomyces sp. F-3]|nr:hypothetical protein STXM2123_671 [Streptomyces sp. F-3]